MSAVAESRVNWRMLANVAAAAICVAAGVWVWAGGERAFLISYVDLGFHELGHLLFFWGPGLVAPMAGSVVQVLVPLGLAAYFGSRRESYASALMFAWAATSAANVAVYAADAQAQSLQLLGNGRHDWAWILGSIGHVGWAPMVSSGIRWFGVALALVGLMVALTTLLAPHAKERAEERKRAARDAQEAELAAKAPRREPRNRPPVAPYDPANPRRDRQAPAAPAGRL
jgi:hypothetical protein